MPHIAKIARLAAVFVLGAAAAFAFAEPLSPSPAEEEIERLEQRLLLQETLALRRVEDVETRMEILDRHFNRIFLIFGLSAALVLMLVIAHQRTRSRLDSERVRQAVREAEMLSADIRRELKRPETEFLRVSHFLRRTMRESMETPPSDYRMAEIRSLARDPNLPVSLHYIAQILAAEHDSRWRDAEHILEQLRPMDPEDPFVLLHLHRAHTHIANSTGDPHDRKRHLRIANQFYAQFAAVAQMQHLPKPKSPAIAAPPPAPAPQTETAQTPKFRPNTIAAAPQNVPPPPPKVEPPQTVAPTQTTPPPAVSPPAPKTEPAQTAKLKPPAIVAARPNAPVVHKTSPPEIVPQQKTIPSSEVAATTPPPPQPPAAPKTEVQNNKNNTAMRPSAGGGFLPKKAGEIPWRKIGTAVKHGSSHIFGEVAHIARKIGGGANGEMPPFLPVPNVSEVPEQTATASEKEMWRCIRAGDLTMAQAGATLNLRRRNRLIDRALTSYAQAQGHKTNETLYLNWGLSLLGKALHLPEKKRDPFYNAAIDKFLAGNVIAPHCFDFSLATLYAIIGRETECREWLAAARESGTLDVESLRSAPDFDGFRDRPWFSEFMRD